MTIRKTITLTVLRNLVRLAWRIEFAGDALGATGRRLDDWAWEAATARGIDPKDVLEPLRVACAAPKEA